MRKPRRSYRRRPLRNFEPLEGRRLLATDLAQIAGTVVTDLDNGADADVLASGQTVELFLDDGDATFEPGAGDDSQGTQVTGANGEYTFDNLIAGDYWVRINPTSGTQTRTNEDVSSLISFDANDAMGSVNLTIDDFTEAQDATATRNNGDALPAVVNSADGTNTTDGGPRDLQAEYTGGTSGSLGIASDEFNSNQLSISSTSGVTGTLRAVWDGTDADADAVDFTGLNLDILDSGTNSAFVIEATADREIDFRLRIYDRSGNISEATVTITDTDGFTGDAGESISVSFVDNDADATTDGDFTAVTTNAADLSSIGAIELIVDATGASGLDAQLEVIGIVGFTTETADFTVLPEMSLGDLVYTDRDNNGIFDGTDFGIGGVALTLFEDVNEDDLLDGGDVQVGTTTTATSGTVGSYEFTGLLPGKYLVRVDADNFDTSEALENLVTSTGNDVAGEAPDPDTPTADGTDKGTAQLDGSVISKNVMLVGGEESGDGESDDNRNSTIDFGFYGYDLTITKQVDLDNSVPDGTLVYTMVVTNDGPGDATGVEFTDTLPTGVTFVSATTTEPGGTVVGSSASQTVTSSIGDLASTDSPVTIVITASVDADAAIGTPLVNTAAVTGVDETGPTPNTATDQTIITPRIDLQLLKSDDDNDLPLEPGDTVVYTLRVQNNGPSGATNVVVTDTLPSGLTFDSTGSTSPDTNTSGSGGTTVLTYDLGALASMANGGAEQVITVRATVDEGFTGTVTNNASVVGAETETNTANNSESAQSTVNAPVIDLAITKVDDDLNQPVTDGQTIRYDLTVQNNGPSDATGVVVTDTLPAGLTFVSTGSTVPTTNSTVGNGTTTLTYDLGDLASTTNGGLPQTITILATVDAGLEGPVTNTASVVGVEAESTLANNSSSASSTPALGSINGRVFIDADRDLDFDPEDAGIAGVLIELFDSTTDLRLATTTTGTDGTYSFDDLPAGTYYVAQGTLPAVFEDLGEATDTPGAQTPGDNEITSITVVPGTSQAVAPENNFTAALNLNKRTFFWSSGVFT